MEAAAGTWEEDVAVVAAAAVVIVDGWGGHLEVRPWEPVVGEPGTCWAVTWASEDDMEDTFPCGHGVEPCSLLLPDLLDLGCR